MLLVLSMFHLISNWQGALLVLPVVLLSGFLFASLGMLVTSFAKSYDFFAYYFTLILGPMFFFSGTFFPLSQLPFWARSISWIMPLTHSVALIRALLFGQFSHGLWGHLVWILGVGMLIFVLAIRRMTKRLRV